MKSCSVVSTCYIYVWKCARLLLYCEEILHVLYMYMYMYVWCVCVYAINVVQSARLLHCEDILYMYVQVLSSAATQLSTPSPVSPLTPVTTGPPPPTTPQDQQKPWQQVIDERIKAKTRIISKVSGCGFPSTNCLFNWWGMFLQGPQKPPQSSPNKFLPVAPLFFFPLMAPYDVASPALDLLGRDHLLLGNLVRTLGNVLWCAANSPNQVSMATALLNFVWALRYHPSRYVHVMCMSCDLQCV